MDEVKLTRDEVEVPRRVLRTCAIRRWTGEIGVVYGMNRFVSTHQSLKKEERDALDNVARKLGLSGISQYGDEGAGTQRAA